MRNTTIFSDNSDLKIQFGSVTHLQTDEGVTNGYHPSSTPIHERQTRRRWKLPVDKPNGRSIEISLLRTVLTTVFGDKEDVDLRGPPLTVRRLFPPFDLDLP